MFSELCWEEIEFVWVVGSEVGIDQAEKWVSMQNSWKSMNLIEKRFILDSQSHAQPPSSFQPFLEREPGWRSLVTHVIVWGSDVTTTHVCLPRQKWGFPWLSLNAVHGLCLMDSLLSYNHFCLGLRPTLLDILKSDAIYLLFHPHQWYPGRKITLWLSEMTALSSRFGAWPAKAKASGHTSVFQEPGRALCWGGPTFNSTARQLAPEKTICWLPRTQGQSSR